MTKGLTSTEVMGVREYGSNVLPLSTLFSTSPRRLSSNRGRLGSYPSPLVRDRVGNGSLRSQFTLDSGMKEHKIKEKI